MDELVFAIPTSKLRELITYKEKGFTHVSAQVLTNIVSKGLTKKRDQLETNPDFKQLIPYGLISCCNSYYLFKRSSKQTEIRLHNRYTLGVGGHMNPGLSHENGVQYILGQLKREFFEEIELLDNCIIENIKFLGIINDDTIEVGRYHLGLLYHIRVSNQNIRIAESELMSATWVNEKQLAGSYNQLESWSQIAFDHFIR